MQVVLVWSTLVRWGGDAVSSGSASGGGLVISSNASGGGYVGSGTGGKGNSCGH